MGIPEPIARHRFFAASLALHGVIVLGLSAGAAMQMRGPARDAPITVRLLALPPEDATPAGVAPRPSQPPKFEPSPPRAPERPKPVRRAPRQTETPAPGPRQGPAPPPAPAAETASTGPEVGAASPSSGAAATPGGAIDVASAGPAGAGGASAIDAYVAQVRGRIAREKRYPANARDRRIEGTVIALLAIASDGALREVRLEGDPPSLLARATRQAVEDAAPFAAPPAGLGVIRVPVRYALHDRRAPDDALAHAQRDEAGAE